MKTLSLFEDMPAPPADCAIAHDWTKTVTVWAGESIERLTWTCGRCGQVRGRVA